MPRRANYTPRFPDTPFCRLRAVRGTRRTYFLSVSRGNVYHRDDCIDKPGRSPMLRPGSRQPLKPDLKHNSKRPRYKLMVTGGKAGKKKAESYDALGTVAYTLRDLHPHLDRAIRRGPCTFVPKYGDWFDLRPQRIVAEPTDDWRLVKAWKAAALKYNILVEDKHWKSVLAKERSKRARRAAERAMDQVRGAAKRKRRKASS